MFDKEKDLLIDNIIGKLTQHSGYKNICIYIYLIQWLLLIYNAKDVINKS